MGWGSINYRFLIEFFGESFVWEVFYGEFMLEKLKFICIRCLDWLIVVVVKMFIIFLFIYVLFGSIFRNIDFEFGCVICFGYWDSSKYVIGRDLKNVWVLEFVFWLFWEIWIVLWMSLD